MKFQIIKKNSQYFLKILSETRFFLFFDIGFSHSFIEL